MSTFSSWYNVALDIQEKVYFCKCDNLKYVKCQCSDKGEYVNHEKKDIR